MILPSVQIKKYGRKVLAGYNDLATTTFPETVKMLIGEEGEGRQKSCPAPSQDFRLPEKNEDNEKIIKYLTEKREIEKKLVEEWIDRGDIYEEKKHHNVIFVGRELEKNLVMEWIVRGDIYEEKTIKISLTAETFSFQQIQI